MGDGMMDIDNAKEQLQDILNKEEYQVYYEDHRSFIQVWWDRFIDWLEKALTNIFPSFAPSNGFANGVLFLVIAVVIVLIAFFVFLSVRKRKRQASFYDAPPLGSKREQEWSYERHLQEARKQEDSDDYTEATRHLFLAVLLYLDEKELLKARGGKTNWEYVLEIRQINKQYAEKFYHLAITFDEVVYGKYNLEDREFSHFRDEATGLFEKQVREEV